MFKAMECGIEEIVRTPVALLHSLSAKYPWERYEPPYPPCYGLKIQLLFFLKEGFGIK